MNSSNPIRFRNCKRSATLASRSLFAFAALAAGVLPTSAASANPTRPLVVIDPGHEPSKPGAAGVCGLPEFQYNDAAASRLATALTASYGVLKTRNSGQEVEVFDDLKNHLPDSEREKWDLSPTLYARAALANRAGADAFVSLHHDSTPAEHQTSARGLCDGADGKTLAPEFLARHRMGYSIFVYRSSNQELFSSSLRLARLVAEHLRRDLGRSPSTYHTEDCSSCQLLDSSAGVWHQNLAVLRAARMPAILVELGVIVESEDELRINTNEYRKAAAAAIRAALDEFFAGS